MMKMDHTQKQEATGTKYTLKMARVQIQSQGNALS